MTDHFKPAWWLPGPHLQTLWPALIYRKVHILHRHEQFELPDGDFLDLVWVGKGGGPIVLVLHGLSGSVKSPYVIRILQTIYNCGWQGVLMHFRNCGGKPNRLPRSYHSGETGDLKTVVAELIRRDPQTPILAVGYSLGGNVLLKWLGETGAQNPLKAAAAISIPFELEKTVTHLSKGFSKLYQWRLVRELIRNHQRKFEQIQSPIDFGDTSKLNTLWEFDNTITAPLHGFNNAKEYYTQSSSRRYLANIQVPTLILHSRNDPFTTSCSIPKPHEVSSQITLEISEQGGHVGFVMGKYPWKPIYWLEQKIIRYFKEQL